jgi:hypothetical protein
MRIITAASPASNWRKWLRGSPAPVRLDTRAPCGLPDRTSGSTARQGLDHGPGFDLRDERRPARLSYYDNYLVDNARCVIVGVQATTARLSQESVAARDMIERYRQRYGYLPRTLAAREMTRKIQSEDLSLEVVRAALPSRNLKSIRDEIVGSQLTAAAGGHANSS